MGTKITFSPVTKPAFDARVYFRPIVWKAYAKNSTVPNIEPCINVKIENLFL